MIDKIKKEIKRLNWFDWFYAGLVIGCFILVVIILLNLDTINTAVSEYDTAIITLQTGEIIEVEIEEWYTHYNNTITVIDTDGNEYRVSVYHCDIVKSKGEEDNEMD